MKSYKATVVSVSELAAEFRKHYHYDISWYTLNELIFGDKWVEGIRRFYFGDDIEHDDQLSVDLCEFLSEEFPDLDTIYIDTED